MTEKPRASRRRVRSWAVLIGVSVAGVAAWVHASVPHMFTKDETLTADALNGNLAALDQRLTALESLLPAGTIVAYGGPASNAAAKTIPNGWLLCDGSAVSRTTYSTLFAAIAINFGGGDGVGTFNLPDLRGRFLRGVDSGAKRDPDAAMRLAMNPGGNLGDLVGSTQAGATSLPKSPFQLSAAGGHSHSVGITSDGGRIPGNLVSVDPGNVNTLHFTATGFGAGSVSSVSDHTHSVQVGGDGETRPLNASVNYLIKF